MVPRASRQPGRLAHWLGLARPGLVITLGNEVAAFARGYLHAKDAQQHLYGKPVETSAFGPALCVVHCAHPGVFVRGGPGNHWISKHKAWCLDPGRALVGDVLRARTAIA